MRSIDDLFVFVAVVRDGGFTPAAASLGMTKQAVSSRVARIEQRLGVRLLERTTRRIRTTDAGAAYYERCRIIASQVDDAEREVRDRQARPTGLLRISAPYLFGRRFLAPLAAAYMQEHDAVRVELVLADRRANLIEEGFDLAIRVGVLNDSSLTAKRLGQVRVSVVARRSVARRRRAIRAEDLGGMPTIGTRPTEDWRVEGKKWRISPGLVVNDLEIACEAAVAGLGIANLPELITRPHLESGALRRCFPRDEIFVPVHVVYPSREFLASKVRVFLDMLAAARMLT